MRAAPEGPAGSAPIPEATTMATLALLPGGTEIWIILAVVLLLFGSRKLPELARSMGSSITQFKKGLKEPEGEKLPPAAPSKTDESH